jgi:MFS family permease
VPIAVFSFVSGTVADRFDRRRIVQLCVLGSAAVAGMLAWHSWKGSMSLWVAYSAAVGFGMIRAFSAPANAALLSVLVPSKDLAGAVTWQTILFQVSLIGGPAAAGLLFDARGPAWVYGGALALYVGTFLCYLGLRPLPSLPRRDEPWARTLTEGLRFVLGRKVLLGAITLDLFAVLLGGATALMPIFAKDVLGRGADAFGLLKAAPAIGAGLAGLYFAFRPLRRRAGPALLLSVAAFGGATILFGLSRSYPLAVVALALLGAFDTVSVVVRHTLIQLLTPNEMRGRVSAVAFVFISASNELGDFESGVTAAWWGLVPAILVGGAGTIGITLLWALLFPGLRRIDRLEKC